MNDDQIFAEIGVVNEMLSLVSLDSHSEARNDDGTVKDDWSEEVNEYDEYYSAFTNFGPAQKFGQVLAEKYSESHQN